MQAHSSIASCNRCISASMYVIGAHGETEKLVVNAKDGVQAEMQEHVSVTLRVIRAFSVLPRLHGRRR